MQYFTIMISFFTLRWSQNYPSMQQSILPNHFVVYVIIKCYYFVSKCIFSLPAVQILVTNPILFRVRPAKGRIPPFGEAEVELRLLPVYKPDLSEEEFAIFFESDYKQPQKLDIR